MEDDERLRTLRNEISARLEKVRGDLTDEEFTELVNDIAANARKSETRNQEWGSRARSITRTADCRN